MRSYRLDALIVLFHIPDVLSVRRLRGHISLRLPPNIAPKYATGYHRPYSEIPNGFTPRKIVIIDMIELETAL